VPTIEPHYKRQRVSIWVKLFVLFHIIAITSWAMPNPPSSVESGKMSPAGSQWVPYWNKKYLKTFPPLTDYLMITGFWQYWDMFAPDPAQSDTWGDAQVVFRDGSVKHYQYPRMFLLPIHLKHVKERYRKYFERANSDDYNYLWPQFALRIASQFDDPENPPVSVKLYRHWITIAPAGQPQPQEYNTYMYYQYVVDQKQLAQMRETNK